MKRLALVASLALLCAAGCKKEKPSPLIQQNNDTNGQTNGGTNGTPNGTPNGSTVNSIASEIIPADPDRDYSGSPPSYSGGAVGQFVHDLNTAECERMFSCLTSSTALYQLKSWRSGSIGECVSARNSMRSPTAAQAAADAGRTTIDAAAATECLGDIGALNCTTVGIASLDALTMLPVCQNVLVGTAVQTELCDQNWDCGENLYCSQSFSGCYGLCETTENFANTCGDEVCALDQFCDQGALTCRDFYGANVDCVLDSQCGEGLVCSDGKCSEFSLVAEESGCGGKYICRPGLLCNRDDVCEPQLGMGAPCDTSFQCEWSLTCGGGSCSPSSTVCEVGDDCPSRRCLDGTCIGPNETCYEIDPL